MTRLSPVVAMTAQTDREETGKGGRRARWVRRGAAVGAYVLFVLGAESLLSWVVDAPVTVLVPSAAAAVTLTAALVLWVCLGMSGPSETERTPARRDRGLGLREAAALAPAFCCFPIFLAFRHSDGFDSTSGTWGMALLAMNTVLVFASIAAGRFVLAVSLLGWFTVAGLWLRVDDPLWPLLCTIPLYAVPLAALVLAGRSAQEAATA